MNQIIPVALIIAGAILPLISENKKISITGIILFFLGILLIVFG